MMELRRASRLAAVIALAALAPATGSGQVLAAEAAGEFAAQGSMRTLYLALIRQARADGRARAALAYLDDFDRQYPHDRDALVLRINCLLDLGQKAQAREALKRLPEDARDGAILEVRGHVAAAQGDWSQAARDYAAALAASPANPLIGNALGYARLRSGQVQQAVEALKAACDLAPRETVIRNNLVLALTLAGRKAEADALLAAIRDPAMQSRIRREVASEAARIGSVSPTAAATVEGSAHG